MSPLLYRLSYRPRVELQFGLARKIFNVEPTPKAFGAALFLEVINGEFWIFLSLQQSLHFPRFFQCRNFLSCDDFDFLSEALRSRGVAAQMLRKASLKIDS